MVNEVTQDTLKYAFDAGAYQALHTLLNLVKYTSVFCVKK